jgi:hypothetical protein
MQNAQNEDEDWMDEDEDTMSVIVNALPKSRLRLQTIDNYQVRYPFCLIVFCMRVLW